MPTVTGTLETILGSEAELGSVEVALCGFGSRVPRMSGSALAARITDEDVTVADDGTFSFDVTGNDQIAPPGTYYTVTVKDDNGDIIQVNAYVFFSTTSNYDLNSIDPFDPSQGPPALPPLILNLLLVIPASDTMTFDGTDFTTFQTTLTMNVTSPAIANMKPGNLYTFIIIQDGTGGHTFTWPPGVYNAAPIDSAPNSITIQTFVANGFGNLYAIGPGTYYP